jgi:hypothetical protein
MSASSPRRGTDGPEIRVGPDYFAIDYYPQATLVSTILFIPIRKVEPYPEDGRAVYLEVAAEHYVKRYLGSAQQWTEYWRELRK